MLPRFLAWATGFPSGSVVNNPPANVGAEGDMGSIPGLGRSTGGGNGKPLQYFLPGESHGQRSLVGYSPRGHKESDVTEWLNMQLWLPSETGKSFPLWVCAYIDIYTIKTCLRDKAHAFHLLSTNSALTSWTLGLLPSTSCLTLYNTFYLLLRGFYVGHF